MRCALLTGVQTCALPIWRRRLPLGPWDLREAAAAGRRSRGLLAHFSDEGLRAEEDLMAKLLPQPQAVLGFDVCQSPRRRRVGIRPVAGEHRLDRQPVGRGATRSEEHTSELQSLMRISYAVFCMK